MRLWAHIILSVAAIAGLAACASLAVKLPELEGGAIEAEQKLQSQEALALYFEYNTKLQDIGHKVLAANAPLCARSRDDLGLQTVRLRDMPKSLRDIAQEQMNLDEHPHLIFAVDDKAGIELGDQIVHEGKPIMARDIDSEQDELRILRDGKILTFTRPELTPICDYKLKLSFTPTINAIATGQSIIMTTGMMDFANDDELAMIIGHELAHNNLSHIRKIVQNRILSFGGAASTRQFESEADYAGLYYMARAGFEIDGAEQFWRRYAQRSISSLTEAKSHPITAERFARLAATIDEINNKRALGEPLIPNLK